MKMTPPHRERWTCFEGLWALRIRIGKDWIAWDP